MPKTNQSVSSNPGGEHLGFLATDRDDALEYVGGLLVTTERGRPLEFHYSLPIRPTETHRVLYGKELEPHIFESLIGTPLLEQTQQAMRFLVTDQPLLLGLRPLVQLPIVVAIKSRQLDSPSLQFHREFPGDAESVQDWLSHHPSLDITEPLIRIWEAIREVVSLDSRAAA